MFYARSNRSLLSLVLGLALWLALSEPGHQCARSAYQKVTATAVSWGILVEVGEQEPSGPEGEQELDEGT